MTYKKNDLRAVTKEELILTSGVMRDLVKKDGFDLGLKRCIR